MAYVSPHEKYDDYIAFTPAERKDLIIKYVKVIQSLGFRPVKVIGRPDPAKMTSFRAMIEFDKEIGGMKRKHTSFFECRNFSDFSLRKFREDFIEGTTSTAEDFKKALKIRIGGSGFTDEEIVCAILPTNLELRMEDVWVDGKLVIPKGYLDNLFYSFNLKGGSAVSQRLVRRKK